MHPLYDFLIHNNWSKTWAWWADFTAITIILLFISWILRIIARFIIVNASHKISGATKTTIDDALIEHKLPKNVSRFVPYFFLHAVIPFWSNGNDKIDSWITAIVDVYAVLVAILITRSLLRTFRQQLQKQKQFKDKPKMVSLNTNRITAEIAPKPVKKYTSSLPDSMESASSIPIPHKKIMTTWI